MKVNTKQSKRTLAEFTATAHVHADGDFKCGRTWQCACAACRVMRARGLKIERNG